MLRKSVPEEDVFMEVTEVVNKWIEKLDIDDDWPHGLDIGTILDRYIFPEIEERLGARGRHPR